jgi:hypothetical protein
MVDLSKTMPGPFIPDKCYPDYMNNCARVSFNGCVEKKIEKTFWKCSKWLPQNSGKDDPCQEMNTSFQDTKRGGNGKPVSMFFNNTLEEVKQQVNFCSFLNYGSDYFNMPNVANATMHYANSYFSFSDHLFLVIIDCSDEPWNKTMGEE